LETFVIKVLGFAIVIATGSFIGVAQAEPGGCLKYGAAGAVLGAVGGCGVGMYERHEYKKHLKELKEQQEMIGPKATGSGENL
jgi:uncharacterized membrane protein